MIAPLRWRGGKAIALWSIVLVVATIAMLAARDRLDKAHVALVFVLVVLGGSAAGGRGLGLALAAGAFFNFNWFFLPPYGTFIIRDPLDWLVLVAFLVTGVVAAQLLYRAQEEARAAEARATEVDRLATVGAETLSAGRAEDAVGAVVETIRTAAGAGQCEIYHPDATGTLVRGWRVGTDDKHAVGALVEWVAASGSAAAEQRDGTVRLHGARPELAQLVGNEVSVVQGLLLPLQSRGRTVGVLRIRRAEGLELDRSRLRVLDALSYYAALAVERVRLVADAERAEALREADRLKDALLAAVSHDLRTPLTTIRALAHELATAGDDRAEIIVHETDRLNRSVADLLDLSQLNAGALPVRLDINAVDDLLGALLQRVEPAIGEGRIVVILPPNASVLFGRFDLVHSLRVLANLVENAVKYAPDSSIEIAVSQAEDHIAIAVSDRGPGIPTSDVERVFEPFYRAQRDERAAPDVGGTGLGLSIARRLAEMQGGTLRYTPRTGGGSRFVLTLPAATPPSSL